MNNVVLNLVVLRSPDVARAAAFYTRLGLQFSQHRHGNGPEHFAAELSGGVFELYAALNDYPGAVDGRSNVSISRAPPAAS